MRSRLLSLICLVAIFSCDAKDDACADRQDAAKAVCTLKAQIDYSDNPVILIIPDEYKQLTDVEYVLAFMARAKEFDRPVWLGGYNDEGREILETLSERIRTTRHELSGLEVYILTTPDFDVIARDLSSSMLERRLLPTIINASNNGMDEENGPEKEGAVRVGLE